MILTPGATRTISARSPTPANSCSRLSRMRRSCLRRRNSSSCSCPPFRRSRSASARAGARPSTESSAAKGMKTMPWGKVRGDWSASAWRSRSASREPTSRARRVLPLPPSPVRVTSRVSGSASLASRAANSLARPKKGVADAGRFQTGTGEPGRSAVSCASLPERMASQSALVSSDGSAPSSSCKERQSFSYWARASLRWPLRASRRMTCRWPSSCHGSSSTRRRAWASAGS